ncbi:hypothetical protein [Sediminispirochaeta bajacaliforniensis]|uniref:hypothetical protein n=1 Tax=Sediminispirochaeta bajacaliforniensis TaxID=148 RepID=UPI000379D028|nr:hypothetical protein [Sediminispirochaeta bajacaliforniensis]
MRDGSGNCPPAPGGPEVAGNSGGDKAIGAGPNPSLAIFFKENIMAIHYALFENHLIFDKGLAAVGFSLA